MPATLNERPLPQCTAPAPKPACCGWCDGTGVIDDLDFGEVCCLECLGSGEGSWVPVCEFRLDPSRTHAHRRCQYDPNRGRLRITMGRKFEDYAVAEIEPGDGWRHGRAFVVVKDKGRGESRNVFVAAAAGEYRCDCEGETFLAAAKANQKAHEEGRAVFPSFGCKHLDAVVPLLKAGWFDLPAIPTPEPTVT